MISVGIRYVWQIYKKEVIPTLSTWVIFLVGVALSFATYMVAENCDWKSYVLNTVDLFVVLITTIYIVKWGRRGFYFKSFEKFYFISASMVIIVWIIFGNAHMINILSQGLIMLGYFPTIHNLIKEKRNTESFSVWGLVFVIGTIALFPAKIGGNALAIVYAARTMFMVAVILSFMFYYEVKTAMFYYSLVMNYEIKEVVFYYKRK